MIDVLDRQDRRFFIHGKILKFALPKIASFIPGGSTALSLVRSFTGGSAPQPKRKKRSPRIGNGDAFSFDRDFIRRRRPPSIPPVNPVRTAVIRRKPTPPLKPAPPPRRRVPQIQPITRPHVLAPVPRPVAPARPFVQPSLGFTRAPRAPIRRPAMPIHSRIRKALFPPALAPAAALVSGDGCIVPGQRRDQFGNCSFFLGEQLGRDDAPVGEAVMGRYGAAYVPGSMIIDRAVCLKGDVVGDDGLCYPRRSIKNSDREWPRGRRPLLTGGDMRAISIAHRAGARMTRAAGRLQDMGIIKKPIVRKQIKKKH